LRKNPVEIGEATGAYLVENAFARFNVASDSYIELNDSVWVDTFNAFLENKPETVKPKRSNR
jgi:hypothetical protein